MREAGWRERLNRRSSSPGATRFPICGESGAIGERLPGRRKEWRHLGLDVGEGLQRRVVQKSPPLDLFRGVLGKDRIDILPGLKAGDSYGAQARH